MDLARPITSFDGHDVNAVIALAIPCHDSCSSMFAFDLTSLYGYTLVAVPDDVALTLNFQPGTYVHCARQDLLKTIMEAGATYICWIDSDMRFPKDALVRLIKHNVDVVGINYCTRGIPPRYVAIKQAGVGDVIGANLETTEFSSGLEEVDAVGFGFVLMKAQILKDIPLDVQPAFWFEWVKERKTMMGEDVYFCRTLREKGIKIYVDHDLSKECAHQGVFDYKLGHIDAWKEGSPTIQASENGRHKPELHLVPA